MKKEEIMQADRQTQVDEEIDKLAWTCENCLSVLESLKKRLENTVLRDEPQPDKSMCAQTVERQLVLTASRIRDKRRIVQQLVDTINDIINRIEI